MQNKPKIVLLDNNDSFTYNWVELLRQITGVAPQVLSHDFRGLIPAADAYIFSPGPGLPSERPLMKKVMGLHHQSKPILGICLGHQFIIEYFGGKLKNLGKLNHGLQVEVSITSEAPVFKGINSPFKAALYHSWAADTTLLEQSDFTSIANFEQINMAVIHRKWNVMGMQFHPESFLTLDGQLIITNWLKEYVYPSMTE